jgi:hypothetical protein
VIGFERAAILKAGERARPLANGLQACRKKTDMGTMQPNFGMKVKGTS